MPVYGDAAYAPGIRGRISGYLNSFARSLPAQIDALAISRIKLAGNVVWCRETLFWRFTELAQDALEKLDEKRIASAMLLTRAAIETGAALLVSRKQN